MAGTPAWLSPFSLPFRRAIRPLLEEGEGRRLACFDADGTLWAEDIGEAFLRWLIASDNLPRHRGSPHIWEDYEARVRQDRTAGYAWAAQLMAGLTEDQVLQWSRWLVASWPNTRPAMAGLLRGLGEAGLEVWIVSASNRWTIRAAAALVGVPQDRVLGIEVETDGGVLTERVVHPPVCMAGKVEAIRKHLGADPVLACGDSLGDLEMLSSARVPLVVGRKDQRKAALLQVAAERSWPVHLF